WKGWAILLRQKQKKLIMLPSETMIWQPEFTDKTLSRKPGAVQGDQQDKGCTFRMSLRLIGIVSCGDTVSLLHDLIMTRLMEG
ncbi:hypothetical protein, partial [Escherichia coli]|uniref:hypothetical protein n=1 Tax=Escherichia coli TaxID=562 RepID=UPI001BC8A0F7